MTPASHAELDPDEAVARGGIKHWLAGTAGAGVAQLLLLLVAGYLRRHALNPDGVAYLRIAGYYARGQSDLAISGYWGPLLSWLMAPAFALGLPPLAAARLVMGLTAVFFFWGCVAVFRSFHLSDSFQRLGVWLAVVLSACWSVENITPDLLAAGFVCFAFSRMAGREWLESWAVAAQAGLLWGLAYLSKAAALPLAIFATAGMAVLWRRAGFSKKIARGVLITLFSLGVAIGPWMAIISSKYGSVTISRSARLNHAMVGPADVEPLSLDRGFHQPEAGRVTIWEDSDLPYPDWSPFASAANALHQFRIIARNIPIAIVMLTSVCALFPWLLVIFPLRLCQKKWRSALAGQKWWWSLLPVAGLGLQYLPANLLISEQRYFYAAFPFLFVACVGACFDWNASKTKREPRFAVMVLLAAAFLAPTLARPSLWRNSATAGECAWQLARKLSGAGIRGPVAGSAPMHGGRAGLYVAFHLGEPWLGDPRELSAENFKQSRARLVIVRRDLPVNSDLERDRDFLDLDGRLFASPEEAARFPLKAYALARP